MEALCVFQTYWKRESERSLPLTKWSKRDENIFGRGE